MATGLFALGSQDPQQNQTMTAQQQQPGGLYALGSPTMSPGLTLNTGGSFKDMSKDALAGAGNLQGPNYSGLNPLNPGGYTENRNQATSTAQNYFNNQLNDRYKTQDQDFAQKMANQGIDAGSEAYKRNSDLYNSEKNKAYQDAAFQAYQAGGLEQQQAFNQGLASRQQGSSEADNAAAFGLNKANSILGNLGQFSGQENQANMQNSQQQFQGGENAADRTQATNLQKTQNTFEGGQNDANRALQGRLSDEQNNYLRALLSQLGVAPATGGGGGGTSPVK